MKKLKTSCDLQTCMLCRLCQKEWIPAVAAHRSNFKFNKGNVIFEEGETVKGIFFVYEGTVKVHKHWGADKELIMQYWLRRLTSYWIQPLLNAGSSTYKTAVTWCYHHVQDKKIAMQNCGRCSGLNLSMT